MSRMTRCSVNSAPSTAISTVTRASCSLYSRHPCLEGGPTACGFHADRGTGLWLAYDRLGSGTQIFTRGGQRDAMTVYHCAWDQTNTCG